MAGLDFALLVLTEVEATVTGALWSGPLLCFCFGESTTTSSESTENNDEGEPGGSSAACSLP